MNIIEKAQATKCFCNLTLLVIDDPDPKAREKLVEEFNCKNCGYYKQCRKVEEILK